MSDEFDTNDSAGIKSLREAHEASQKKVAEMEKLLSSYQAKERTTSVADFLKAKGISEKVAGLYSGEDTSEEALNKWVEDFADVFNPQQTEEQRANAQSAARVAAATQGQSSLPPTASYRPGDVIPIGDVAEADHLMKTLTVPQLQEMGWLPK